MTQHTLQGRTDDEVLWFQRRDFLQAAAAWVALGGASTVQAQSRSNVVQISGDAMVNGTRLVPHQTIQTGDQVTTGPKSTVIFTIGTSAFHVRQNSTVVVERGASLAVVSMLRMITGAVASVWGPGNNRRIVTPTLTAGIRGTGVYTEVFSNQDNRSYFCNCYGTVDLQSGTERTVSQATYHQAFWSESTTKKGSYLQPAKAINHTDEELEYLAKLVDQRTAWQIRGKPAAHDSIGY